MTINKTTQFSTDPNTIPVDTSTGSQTIVEALDDRTNLSAFNSSVVPVADVGISARELARTLEQNAQRSNTVKFCTFNIWGNTARQNYGDGSIANRDYLAAIKKSTLEIQAEYVGFQETYKTPTTLSNDYGIYPLINSFFGLSHDFGLGREYGNTSVSARVITESGNTVYADPPGGGDNETRGFTRLVITVGANSVAVYNTHLSFVQSRAEAMIQELLSEVQLETEAHIIIMGDFNVDYTFLSDFETEGFTIANKDEFNTNNIGGTWYIDNILYKGFSSLVSKGTFDTVPQDAADHKPFFVELNV